MNDTGLQLAHAPIIEAVLDIDCDLPPALDMEFLQKEASEALRATYPKFQQQFIQEHIFQKEGGDLPKVQMYESRGAMQFLSEDGKQLVQFRPNGFSFNRLAPYGSLDDYLPEIESAWNLFVKLTKPVVIRKIGLRMINRMPLPIENGRISFDRYLKTPPRLPQTGTQMMFTGFLEQHGAVDPDSGNHVNIVKTAQLPEGDQWPVIFDIDAFFPCQIEPPAWGELEERIQSLRTLKNQIFKHTLTLECLSLFSPLA
ncbi:MAG: TIGR04255 family protein [Verrucomicrobiota bacterium]